MDDIRLARHIHFSGIKGVGMTALALYAQDRGSTITGSDVAEEFPTQDVLKKRHIRIFAGFAEKNLPGDADALVFSGARPQNPEIEAARNRGLKTLSYAQALAGMVSDKRVIATCGVGGKTTTAAMLATILEKTNRNPSFVVGVGNIQGLGVPGRFAEGKEAVVEADDYVAVPGIDNTPKFLYLKPHIIIVTNIEFDHPDVYRNLEDTKRAFLSFFHKLPNNGTLIANIDNPNLQDVLNRFSPGSAVEVIPYGFSPQASWRIMRAVVQDRITRVALVVDKVSLNLRLNVPGNFNAANATAALIAATQLGIAQQDAIKALNGYAGTMRRFQYLGETSGVEVWDDYAHHPKEISETLRAARKWFPQKRLVAIFQPHTFSRTKALLLEFGKALSLADEVVVTEIYGSARERADPTVSGKTLVKITLQDNPNVKFISQERVVEYLRKTIREPDVVMTLGAGDIYKIGRSLIGAA